MKRVLERAKIFIYVCLILSSSECLFSNACLVNLKTLVTERNLSFENFDFFRFRINQAQKNLVKSFDHVRYYQEFVASSDETKKLIAIFSKVDDDSTLSISIESEDDEYYNFSQEIKISSFLLEQRYTQNYMVRKSDCERFYHSASYFSSTRGNNKVSYTKADKVLRENSVSRESSWDRSIDSFEREKGFENYVEAREIVNRELESVYFRGGERSVKITSSLVRGFDELLSRDADMVLKKINILDDGESYRFNMLSSLESDYTERNNFESDMKIRQIRLNDWLDCELVRPRKQDSVSGVTQQNLNSEELSLKITTNLPINYKN